MQQPGDTSARRASKPVLAGDDELIATSFDGPSHYPVRKRRSCKHECGRVAAKGRLECETCRDRAPGRHEKVRRREQRRASKGHRRSGVGSSITPEEWQAIYRAQEGRCVICTKPLRNRYDPASRGQVAALDHDHVVEAAAKKAGVDPARALRISLCGLLCTYPCNRILVRYWTAERLFRAAVYRRTLPAQAILGEK